MKRFCSCVAMASALATAVASWIPLAAAGSLDGGIAAGNQVVAIGPEAVAKGEWATSVGYKARADGVGASALGSLAEAFGPRATAFGHGSIANAPRSVAFGANSKTSAERALSVGLYSEAQALYAMALGNRALSSGVSAMAAGNGATASAADAVALGRGASALHSGAVALGAGSSTAAAVATSSAMLAGKHYRFAGGMPTSTISVGGAGAERTLTHLAAGRLDSTSTDAVNGSQLNATHQEVNAMASQVSELALQVDRLYGATSVYQQEETRRGNNVVSERTLMTVADNPDAAAEPKTQGVVRAVTVGRTGQARTIRHVAAGTADTDAVNVRQLQSGLNQAVSQSHAYTDARLASFGNDIWALDQRVNELRSDMEAGVAAAMGLKQAPAMPGRTSYYAGVGGYRDQAVLGVSLRRTADSGRWSIEGGLSGNRRGAGGYVGVSGALH
ncbi:MAG TPA: hypothetical protein VM687_00820 [Stenotrophomonas sp.]|nr:hypothetical protein [Stenotrophomonas sp.]